MLPTNDAGSGPSPTDSGEVLTIPAGSSWPFAIVVGLLIVVAVNVAFIYVAVSGADQVVSSYLQQQ